MQTPKPQLQLRALRTRVSSYLELWVRSRSPSSLLGDCPQPMQLR